MQFLHTVELKETKLKADIADALRKGMAATFKDDPSPKVIQIANDFAKFAAPGIADAVVSFIKSLMVSIPSAPQASLVAPPTGGPVTGVVTISDPMIQVG